MMGVVGASGFIGRSVSDHLAATGTPYVALMRQPDGLPADAFRGAGRVTTFSIGGAMDMDAFDGITTLVLAGWATKPGSEHGGLPGEIALNVQPYTELLTDLRQTDVQHLIFLSSGGAVYGHVDQSERIAEDHLCHPNTPYGYGKLCVEKAIQGFWTGDGRRYTIIRPSNPVGLHQIQSVGVHGLFPSVLDAILNHRPVRIYGDGTTVRDYFAVEDLARLVRAADQIDVGNTIVNASSGSGLSINQVVDICAQATGLTPERSMLTDRQPPIAYNVLDNTRAQTVFDWHPTRRVQEVAGDLAQAIKQRLG
ncbi:MAG: NAD-dependent epimerase/dehydratase family protein [Pseudomonadota bacterium]